MGQYASYKPERFYPAFGKMVKELKKHIPCKRILDIGCAKGFLVDVLRKEGYEAYGLDISEYAIHESPKSVRPYLTVCDLNQDFLPYGDSSFDAIICMGTLEYVENQEHGIREIIRVLEPGGHLFMTTLSHPPSGDDLRKFAKTEQEWNRIFESLGFVANKRVAIKVISQYVKKVILYDLEKDLKQSRDKSLAKRVARFLLPTPAKYLMVEYLYYWQVKSGYLQLCYQKSGFN